MKTLVTTQNQVVPLERNPAAVYLATLTSRHSRRAMGNALNIIANIATEGSTALTFEWWKLEYQHTTAIRTELINVVDEDGKPRYKPSTINHMVAALRGVLKQSFNLGLMSADTYQCAVNISTIRDQTLPAGRELSEGEIAALFIVCNADLSPAGARDGAILAILRACALRRSELVALELIDYTPETGQLTVKHGKGRKERIVFVPETAQVYLQRWLEVRGSSEGALFCPINKGGRLTIKGITDQAVYDMLQKRAKEAAVKSFSPHDFRRTFAGDMLDAGADIATVAGIMGHSSVITTQRYDRRGLQARKKAAEYIHIPQPGKQL